MERAAAAHNVSVVIWGLSDLKRHRTLIENMAHIRQSLVAWLYWDLSRVSLEIAGELKLGARSRGELRTMIKAKFGSDAALQVDAAVFRLFFAQGLSFNLHRRYDDESRIERI
jgi:hypothetical protein